MEVQCYKCHSILIFDEKIKISRQEDCHKCHTDLHCCRMCIYFDPTAYNECHESIAERITVKEKTNFCDYFKIIQGKRDDLQNKNTELLKAANSLFKK